MNVEIVGGSSVVPSWLLPMEPLLDIAPPSPEFAKAFVSKGHFVFSVDGSPTSSPWRATGMAVIKKEITSQARAGSIVYAVKDGASWTISASQVETCVSAKIEYVRAVDLVSFCQDIGVQQWGIIRLGRDSEELIADWPGAIAGQISIPWAEAATLSYEARHHIGQWYEWVGETLLAQRGFVK